jgi:hypothetical protein
VITPNWVSGTHTVVRRHSPPCPGASRVRGGNARANLEAAQVYSKNSDGLLEALDLLHDAVVLNREIERETPRSRSLDRDDAYRAVEDAHREIRNDLGGAITVEQ